MKIFFLLTAIVFIKSAVSQITFVTARAGDWSNAATWAGGVVPTGSNSNDSISINHNITVDQDYTSMNAAFNINTGVTLTVAATKRLYRSSNKSFIIRGTMLVNGDFRNSGASSYSQGVLGVAGSSVIIVGLYSTINYFSTEGNFTVQSGGRINSGGNVILRNGLINNGYINLTSPMTLYKTVVNNDTLRTTVLTLEDCNFTNDTRAYINNGTDLFIRDTSTFINTDSSNINNFGRVTITQFSHFINEDSARIRTTAAFVLADSSTYTSSTKAEFLCQSTITISPASKFINGALQTNVGGQTNINGTFENISGGTISSNGTYNINNGGRLINRGIITNTPGTVIVNAGGLLTNETGAAIQSNNTFIIAGTVENKGTIGGGAFTINSSGIINNLHGASCTANNNFIVNGTVNNNGLFTGSALNIGATGILNNNNGGTYNFSNGTAIINGAFTRNGTDAIVNMGDIRGTGAFAGTFEPAVLYPATNSTTGIFTVNGNYHVTAPGKGVQINVNGNAFGTSFDLVIVNGNLNFNGGTLYTTFNYIPANDTVLTFIKATTITGAFMQFSPALPPQWSVLYNSPAAGDVSLVYTRTPTFVRNFQISGIKIYAADGNLYVKGMKEKFGLTIVSNDGKVLYMESFAAPTSDITELSLPQNLPKGIYLVNLITLKGKTTKRVMIRH